MLLSKIYPPHREFALGVWNVDSLIQSDSGDLKHETPLVYEVASRDRGNGIELSVHASPLYGDLYVIWLSTWGAGTITTLKYHLSLYPLTVRFKGTLTFTGMPYFFGISYAGYMSGGDIDGSVRRYTIRDVGTLFSSTPAKDLALPGKGKPLSTRVVSCKMPVFFLNLLLAIVSRKKILIPLKLFGLRLPSVRANFLPTLEFGQESKTIVSC